MNAKTVLCASLALGLAFQAKALTDGSWNFSVAGGEATLTGYAGTGPEDLVLPSSVESEGVAYPVTVVVGPGTLAFQWKKGGAGGSYGVKTNGVDALPCAAADWGAASLAVGSGSSE